MKTNSKDTCLRQSLLSSSDNAILECVFVFISLSVSVSVSLFLVAPSLLDNCLKLVRVNERHQSLCILRSWRQIEFTSERLSEYFFLYILTAFSDDINNNNISIKACKILNLELGYQLKPVVTPNEAHQERLRSVFEVEIK